MKFTQATGLVRGGSAPSLAPAADSETKLPECTIVALHRDNCSPRGPDLYHSEEGRCYDAQPATQ